MPLFAMITHDVPDPERRKETRPDHLRHMDALEASGRVRYGGPLLGENGEVMGSLIILEADSLDDAKATYGRDPYVKHGVFGHYDLLETRQVYPKA